MLVVVQRTLGERLTQWPNGCGPASAAMGAAAAGHGHQQPLRALLSDLLTRGDGATMPELSSALGSLGVQSTVLSGWPLEAVLNAYRTGEVVLGIDAALLYPVRGPALHAVLIAGVLFHDVWPGVELVDPDPRVAARKTVLRARLAAAFDAAGQQALWIPRRRALAR